MWTRGGFLYMISKLEIAYRKEDRENENIRRNGMGSRRLDDEKT